MMSTTLSYPKFYTRKFSDEVLRLGYGVSHTPEAKVMSVQHPDGTRLDELATRHGLTIVRVDHSVVK